MNAVVDPGEVISTNNSDLDRKESVAALKMQKSISNVEEREEHFDIPLSMFRYKGYDSDFFTSWYNILREIFEEIKKMCPEKRILNLALSVLMLPCIVSISLGLVVYSRFKADGKIQTSLEGGKTKKSEVSESTAKRFAYSVFAAIAILINIVVLVTLIIPATLALAIFYLLNRKSSQSLIAAIKISNGLCQNEHQNIEVSFYEINSLKTDIKWNMEVKFPPQFEQLLKDLCKNKDDSWIDIRQDPEHSTIMKLSANIRFKNGLVFLRNEIRDMLATSIQEFAGSMGKLLKLGKKDIICDKLNELLNEFRLKAMNSVDPKLTSYLMQDACRVAFIQAIKFVQEERKKKGDFILEERLKEVLVEQELKSQGKELPTEKEIVKRALKNLGRKDKRATHKVVDICGSVHPEETGKALDNAEKEIENLRKIGQKRYDEICNKLKEIYENGRVSNLTNGALKRKLEDLFKFEYDGQEVEKRLMESKIRNAKVVLSQSCVPGKEKQSLMGQLEDLGKEIKSLPNEKALDKINYFIKEAHSEVVKHGVQNLLRQQKKMLSKNIEDLVSSLDKSEGISDDEDDEISLLFDKRFRDILYLEKMIKECLEQKEYNLLKEKIKEQSEDIRKSMRNGKDLLCFLDKGLMDKHIDSNGKFIKLLGQLESEKEGLLINKETRNDSRNDYREELTSREKIKFAIIEDKLLEVIRAPSKNELLKIIEEAFDKNELLEIREASRDKPFETIRQEAIKKLLEKAELEYCLAEKCIKYPVIKTKNNIKHFCQALLSPLIDNLVENIINNVPKNDKSPWRQPRESFWTAYGYIKTGVVTAIYGNQSIEGKALDVAHDAYKEVEILLKCFESSYEEVGSLIGNVFSDDGETFRKDIWPQIKNHLFGMWDRFFKDVEFTLISKNKNISQEIVETKLDGLTTRKHSHSAQAAGA